MKNIQFIAILILGLSVLSGCVDFNLKPHDAISVDEALRNETDAQTILNGVYAAFKGSESYGIGLSVFPALMTDAAFATTSYTNTYGDIYAWKLNPGLPEVANMWTVSYTAIYNANFIINQIDAIDGDSANISRIKGEALTARALLHYNLVRMYGKAYSQASDADLGVPFVTENKIQNPERNTVKEVYNFIVADLEDAISLLPAEMYEDNTYFTLAFAQGLMARLALDMENYQDAVYYSTQVIGNGGYELESGQGFKDMFTYDKGKEIIWKVGYTVTDFGSAPGYYFYNRNGSDYSPSPDYIPANWWINLLLEKDDVRAETFLNLDNTAWGWAGYLMYKYPTNPMFDSQGMNMPKPMRLAEMYLIRAEANAFLDEDDLAKDDLKVLLENRVVVVPDDNEMGIGDDLKEYIRTERKKELMFEGFYWFDLKRYNEGFVRVPQSNTNVANDLEIAADDYRWQWPIPTVELNANKNIEQNPGY